MKFWTGRDEVTYFSVGDDFCIHHGTTYANFQEKIFPETSGKKFQTFHCRLQWKVWNISPDVSGEIFSWKLAYKEPRYIQKRSPTSQHRSMWLHSWLVQNFADLASHCSTLLYIYAAVCLSKNLVKWRCTGRLNLSLIDYCVYREPRLRIYISLSLISKTASEHSEIVIAL